jgi:hypothetical protein
MTVDDGDARRPLDIHHRDFVRTVCRVPPPITARRSCSRVGQDAALGLMASEGRDVMIETDPRAGLHALVEAERGGAFVAGPGRRPSVGVGPGWNRTEAQPHEDASEDEALTDHGFHVCRRDIDWRDLPTPASDRSGSHAGCR